MPNAAADETITGGVRTPLRHDSAHKHVAGTAQYVDDLPEPPGLLHVYIAMSERAHARIVSMDLTAVRAAPGVACVLTAADIPGTNDVAPVAGDDPLFADGLVEYVGQAIFAVAARTREAARAAARRAVVAYDDLPPVLTIAAARQADLAIEPPQTMTLGDAAAALDAAPRRARGRLVIGGQDHFYLEGQVCLVLPGEDGDVHVYSSTQNPSEVQHIVAQVLGVPARCAPDPPVTVLSSRGS